MLEIDKSSPGFGITFWYVKIGNIKLLARNFNGGDGPDTFDIKIGDKLLLFW